MTIQDDIRNLWQTEHASQGDCS